METTPAPKIETATEILRRKCDTKHLIALCIIAGDDVLDEGFERMLDSVADKVHGVFVSYNGENQDTRKAIMRAIDERRFMYASVESRPWSDDFSDQRNFSFSLAQRTVIAWDWLIWLDCDDVLDEHTDLQLICDTLTEKRVHGGFLEYRYTVDESHRTITAHLKERLFRADVEWRWTYPVHENCIGPVATRTYIVPASCGSVTHHRGAAKPKRDRNRRIVKRWFETSDDPRSMMFMAHETYEAALELPDGREKAKALAVALKLYREYIDSTPADDDSYICNRQSADILRTLGKFSEALDIDLQGVKVKPTWPGSYLGIADTYIAMGAYEDAITWARMTRSVCKIPDDTLQAYSAYDVDYRPLMTEGHALMQLGRFEDAQHAFSEALCYRMDDFTRECMRKAEQQHLATLVDSPAAFDPSELRRARWGTEPNESIAFFAGTTAEKWDGDTVAERGSGGTESTLLMIARHFNDHGWRVVIFGNPVEEGIDCDGIEWWDAGRFHPDEPFTVFVSLRNVQIFDANIKARRRIVWLHDVSMGDVRWGDYGDRFSRVHAVVCPSLAHMKHTIGLYGLELDPADGFPLYCVIPNGIDLTTIKARRVPELDRDPASMIYASSPDRGLPRLLELWPDIVERVPEAKLDIYYGWEAIDAIIASGSPNAPMLRYFKQRTQQQLDELQGAGYQIAWHGRVTQEVLIDALWRSGVMPYPADFFETFGIVFAQACAAGVVPVVPKLGNLPDLVGYSAPVLPGAPNSAEFGPRFVDAVVRASEAPSSIRRDLRLQVESFDWQHVFEHWDGLIDALLEEANV